MMSAFLNSTSPAPIHNVSSASVDLAALRNASQTTRGWSEWNARMISAWKGAVGRGWRWAKIVLCARTRSPAMRRRTCSLSDVTLLLVEPPLALHATEAFGRRLSTEHVIAATSAAAFPATALLADLVIKLDADAAANHARPAEPCKPAPAPFHLTNRDGRHDVVLNLTVPADVFIGVNLSRPYWIAFLALPRADKLSPHAVVAKHIMADMLPTPRHVDDFTPMAPVKENVAAPIVPIPREPPAIEHFTTSIALRQEGQLDVQHAIDRHDFYRPVALFIPVNQLDRNAPLRRPLAPRKAHAAVSFLPASAKQAQQPSRAIVNRSFAHWDHLFSPENNRRRAGTSVRPVAIRQGTSATGTSNCCAIFFCETPSRSRKNAMRATLSGDAFRCSRRKKSTPDSTHASPNESRDARPAANGAQAREARPIALDRVPGAQKAVGVHIYIEVPQFGRRPSCAEDRTPAQRELSHLLFVIVRHGAHGVAWVHLED